MPQFTRYLLALATITLSSFGALPAAAQTINEDIKIVASDAAAGDWFGRAVAISGTTGIVGAHLDSDAAFASGSAYLFDTRDGRQITKLTASDATEVAVFGWSVAISGPTAIVGAYQDSEGGPDSGAAYLFDTTNGQQIAKLTATDAANDDQFGWSVAIAGTTAIVGAIGDDDGGNASGSVYLFDTITGEQIAKLTASDAASGDVFGYSVAISGTTAIVGAYRNDDSGTESGSAYLFDTETGLQIAKLTANDAAAEDWFGYSVAISGTTAIVGAYQDDDAGDFSGSVYLFDTTTGDQLAKLTADDAQAGDRFGKSVSISGTTAVIGAHGDNDGGSDSGSAYLFDTVTGQQIKKLGASDAATNDLFGRSVAISNGNIIVGAYRDNAAGTDSGSAYLFDFALNILHQPQGTIVTVGDTAEFSVRIQDETGIAFQWRRNGIDLTDADNITGSQSSTLQIVATENDEAFYDCVISDLLEYTSDSVVLAVMPDPNECIVDLNNDGTLNFFDVSAFLQAFSAGCP
jgi:FG-GAP repeat protein/immunoglobulin I-set domain protein